MKVFKKILVITIVVVTVFSLTSCGKQKPKNDNYSIGILQFSAHDALNKATEGFKQAVIENFSAENVIFDYQAAAGNDKIASTIAQSFVSKKVDLIMANSSPALLAAANSTTRIPIVGTSVTEYGVALDIEGFDGVIGTNITGTSDLSNLEEQAKMIIELFPEAKNVGLLYCSEDVTSVYQVDIVKDYLEDNDVTVTGYPFTDKSDIADVTEKASDESDVIYIPTDNIAVACAENINSICLPKKVPVFAGEEGLCSICGAYTLTVNYYSLGYKAGLMAVDILTGKANVSEIPIEYDTSPVKKYNAEICEELGLTPPMGYTAI